MPLVSDKTDRGEPFERPQPLVWVACSLAAGIVADRFLSLPIYLWWAAATLAWLGWWLSWRRNLWRCSSLGLLIALVCLGGSWHHWSWSLFSQRDIARSARYANQPICLEAIALQAPRRVPAPAPDPLRAIPQGEQSRLNVRVLRVRNGQRWQPAAGEASLLVEGHLLGVAAGDRLRIFGQIALPKPQANPGEFDFAADQRGNRRLSLLRATYPDCVAVAKKGSRWNWRRGLDLTRRRAAHWLATQLDQEQSPTANAILLGAREGIDREQTEAYFKTGTIHLFAISGLHVGILAGLLFAVARSGLMPRRAALLAVMLLTIGYCLLTDARPPVVRATILVIVTCAAWMSWRRASLVNALALAAIIVLAINPGDLFRTGPQLSFLAVATLAWFGKYLNPGPPADPLDRWMLRSQPWWQRCSVSVGRYVWKLFVVGTIIWLVALPLVMYRFHLFTPVAMLLNPLIALPVTIALFSGFAVLVLGWLLPPLAPWLAWWCDGSLGFVKWAVDLGSQVEAGHFYVAGPPLLLVVIFYGGLAWLFAFPRHRPSPRLCLAGLLLWLAAAAVAPLAVRSEQVLVDDSPLRVTFISVGHGTSVLLELPGGQTMLYDAGQLGSPQSGARGIASVLWSRQINHLDAVVLSHADVDHYNAIPGLLERFTVGKVIVSPMMFVEPYGSIAALRETIQVYRVPIETAFAGDRLKVNGATQLEVLHPPQQGVEGRDNANSVVLLVEHEGKRLLLPGDLESPGMDDLLAELPLDVDVAMAPHHGSAHSSPAGFVQWCSPEWLVISGGNASNAATARRSFEAAGAEVFHTAQAGAITFVIRGDGIDVTTHRP